MNEPQHNHRTPEDILANFTDLILAENNNPGQDAFAPDPELRALEETVLRMKNAFHEEGPSEAVIQKMRQQIVMRWKQHESVANQPFWRRILSVCKPPEQKWQSRQSRRRLSALISLAGVAVVALISIPLLYKDSFNQPAASGQNLNAGFLVAAGALVFLALWFFRRKS